jgi:glycine/serine hydroxymethyltransferase
MKETEMELIGNWVAEVLSHIGDRAVEQKVRKQVAELAGRFPIYESRMKGAVAHARV